MSRGFQDWQESDFELALQELTHGLAPGERDALSRRVDQREFQELEALVSALSIAGLGRLDPAPAPLLGRLRKAAGSRSAPALRARPARTWLAYTGWLAAAALLAMFFLHSAEKRPAALRDELLASATDVQRANWTPTQDALATGVSGDLVWSPSRQEGYMRFRALAPNDPKQRQYQLWIFDSTRAAWEQRPVDGGVFDVGPGAETIVPIDPKLVVNQAALFAVTLEVPGGVVVSERERLIVTAKP